MPVKKAKKATATVKAKRETLAKAAATATAVAEPKKKAVRAKKTALNETIAAYDANTYVVIDHPSEGEVIMSEYHYAIRIGASEGYVVDICFNDGEWIPCRWSAGYWWFDWSYMAPGNYKVVARLRTAEGTTVNMSKPVNCEVQ